MIDTAEETTKEVKLQLTPRREAREKYARFLLERSGMDELSIDVFLNQPQAALEGLSIIELIYTGRYQFAIEVVEAFTEADDPEEILNELSGSTFHAP